MASSFPRSADELGADWLNATLLRAGLLRSPSITSIDVKVIGVGEGFLGQLARVVPHCSGEEPDLPSALIAKFASTSSATRELARGQNYYGREIGFYRDIGAEAGIPIPRCYHAELDEESYTFVLLLEDLHPARPSDQVAGTDPEGSRGVVEAFAELHARWWNSERLAGYDWAKPFIDEQPMEDGLERMKASIERIEAEGTFDHYPEMKALLRYLPPLFRVKPPPPWPYTLVHGDLRSDNVFFPSTEGGRFAMIDWQVSGMDFAARDIARWLVQSIGIEQRRATETELLDHYHAELIRHGVEGYSLRKLKQEYQLSIVVMYLMFSMGLDDVDQTPDRSESLFHVMHERLDAALVDWKVRRLLQALPLMVPVMKLTTWLKMRFSGG